MSGPIRSARYWCPASLGCTPSDPINSGFVANQPSAMGSTNTAPTACASSRRMPGIRAISAGGLGLSATGPITSNLAAGAAALVLAKVSRAAEASALGDATESLLLPKNTTNSSSGLASEAALYRRRSRCCRDGRNRNHPHRRVSEERSRRWTSGWARPAQATRYNRPRLRRCPQLGSRLSPEYGASQRASVAELLWSAAQRVGDRGFLAARHQQQRRNDHRDEIPHCFPEPGRCCWLPKHHRKRPG